MSRPAMALIVDGHVVRPKKVEWDGTMLLEKKRRRKYIVLTAPRQWTEKTLLGSKAMNVFFVSTETATTWDPADPRLAGHTDYELSGATVEPPHGFSVVKEPGVDGTPRPYRVTPEYIYEQSDNSDMKAWNMRQSANKTMLWLAGGCGAAGMVMLYFIFQLLKGTSWFGGA